MSAQVDTERASAQNGDRVSSFQPTNVQRTDTSFFRSGAQAKTNFRVLSFPIWSTRSSTGGVARSSAGGGHLEPEVLNVHQCRTRRTEKGQHSVEISVEGSKERADSKKRKFQWLHFTAMEHMTLQQMRESVMAVKDLEPRRVGLLTLLFDQVKRNERYFVHGKYLEPSIFKQSGTDPITGETSYVSFVAYSYLTLGEHKAARKPTTTPLDVHPPRALMQTHFRLAPSETRDLKQVYRLHKGKKETKLLYIPQFWAVFMDHDVLVTYSCLSLEQMSANGNFIKQELQPTTSEPQIIRFTNDTGDAYNFPVETCQTWFEFCQRLAACKAGKTSKNTHFVCGVSTVVSAENWTEFLEKQTAETIDLRFAKKAQRSPAQIPSASRFTLVPENAQLVKADPGSYAPPQAQKNLPPSKLKDSNTGHEVFDESESPKAPGSTVSRSKQRAMQGYTPLARQAMHSQARSNVKKNKSSALNGYETIDDPGSLRHPSPTETKYQSGMEAYTAQEFNKGYIGPVSQSMNGSTPPSPQMNTGLDPVLSPTPPPSDALESTAPLEHDPYIFQNMDRTYPFSCVQWLEDVVLALLGPVMEYKWLSLAFEDPYLAFNLVQAFEASIHIPRNAHYIYNDYLCFHFTRHLQFVTHGHFIRLDNGAVEFRRVGDWVRSDPAFSAGSNVPYATRAMIFMQTFGPISQPWYATGARQRAEFEDYWLRNELELRTQYQISRITCLDGRGYPIESNFRELDADKHTLEIEYLAPMAWLRYLPGMYPDRHVLAFEIFLEEWYPTITSQYEKGYLFCQTLMPENIRALGEGLNIKNPVVYQQEVAMYQWLYGILLLDNRYVGPKASGVPVPIDYYLLREVFLRDWGRFGLRLGNEVFDVNGRVPKLSDYYPDAHVETRGRTTDRQPRRGVPNWQGADADDAVWPKDSTSRIRSQHGKLEGAPHNYEHKMGHYVLRTATPSPTGMQSPSAKEFKRRRSAPFPPIATDSTPAPQRTSGVEENLPPKEKYRAVVEDVMDGADSDDLDSDPRTSEPGDAVPRQPLHVARDEAAKYRARCESIENSTSDEEITTDLSSTRTQSPKLRLAASADRPSTPHLSTQNPTVPGPEKKTSALRDPALAEDASTGRIQPRDESFKHGNEQSPDNHTVLLEAKRIHIERMEESLFGTAHTKPLRATTSNELPQSSGQIANEGDTTTEKSALEKMEEALFSVSQTGLSRVLVGNGPQSSESEARKLSEQLPEALCIPDEVKPPCSLSAPSAPSSPSHSRTDLSHPTPTVQVKRRSKASSNNDSAVSVPPRGLSLLIGPAKSSTAAAENLSLTQRSPKINSTLSTSYELVESDPPSPSSPDRNLPGQPHVPTPPGSPQTANASTNLDLDMRHTATVAAQNENHDSPAVFDVVYADAARTGASSPALSSATYSLVLKPRTTAIIQVIDADVLKKSEITDASPAPEKEIFYSPIPLADPRHLNLDEILELLGQKDIDFSYDFVAEEDMREVERGMVYMGKPSTSLAYVHSTARCCANLEGTFEYEHVSFPSIENGDASSHEMHGRSGDSFDLHRQRLLEGTEGRPPPDETGQLMILNVAADVTYTSFPALPEESWTESSRTPTPDVEPEAAITAYEIESRDNSTEDGESSSNVSIRLIEDVTDTDEADASLDVEAQDGNHSYQNNISGGRPVLLICDAPRFPCNDIDPLQERRFVLKNQWLIPITFDAEPPNFYRQHDDTNDALVLWGQNSIATSIVPLQMAVVLYDRGLATHLLLHEILALLGQFDLNFDYCFEVGAYASQRLLTEHSEGFEIFFGTVQDDGSCEEVTDSFYSRPNSDSEGEEYHDGRRYIELPNGFRDPDRESFMSECDDCLLTDCSDCMNGMDGEAATEDGADSDSISILEFVLYDETPSTTSVLGEDAVTEYRHSVEPVDAISTISLSGAESVKSDSALDYPGHDEAASRALKDDPNFAFRFLESDSDVEASDTNEYKTEDGHDTPPPSVETTNGILPTAESTRATNIQIDVPALHEPNATDAHQDPEKSERVSPEKPASSISEMRGDGAAAGGALTNSGASTSADTAITIYQQDKPTPYQSMSGEAQRAPEDRTVVENSTQGHDRSRSPKPKVHFADTEESKSMVADRRYMFLGESSAIPEADTMGFEGPSLTSEAKQKAIQLPIDLPNTTKDSGGNGRQDDQATEPSAGLSQEPAAQTARYYIQAPKADHPHFLKWPQKKHSDTDSVRNGDPTATTTSSAMILSPRLPSGDPKPKQKAAASLTEVAKQKEIDLANKRLRDLLEDAHKWCHESSKYHGNLRRLYDNSQTAPQAMFEEAMNVAIERKEAQYLLLQVEDNSSTDQYMRFAENVEWVRRNYRLQEMKVQLANDVVTFLELFAPLQTPCVLFWKVFGVLCTILELPLCNRNEQLLTELQQFVLECRIICKEIEYGVSSYKATIVSFRYILPSELTVAFFCFVQHMICSVGDRATLPPKPNVAVDRFADLKEIIRSKLIASKHALIAMATTDYEPELFNYLGIEGLFAFIVAGLEERGELPLNETNGLVGMYRDFVQKLQLKIEEHPTRRMLEDLNLASSEIKVVLKFLKDRVTYNNEWLKLLKETLHSKNYGGQKFTFEAIRQWHQNSKETERNLREISMQIDELRTRTVQLVDLKNEDQSLAIFVFTIVTVIFLPLSFVTSFFGMNTTDIRDLKQDQRIFWVISIPLTVLVAVLALSVGLKGNRVRSAWTEWKFRDVEEKESRSQTETMAQEMRQLSKN